MAYVTVVLRPTVILVNNRIKNQDSIIIIMLLYLFISASLCVECPDSVCV